jgi:hypothetical protein
MKPERGRAREDRWLWEEEEPTEKKDEALRVYCGREL